MWGQAGHRGNKGVPQDEAARSEAMEDTEAESTEADVREATYLVKKVRGAERSERHGMWRRKGRATSTGEIEDEVRCMAMPNRGSGRGKTSADEEHTVRYPADGQEE